MSSQYKAPIISKTRYIAGRQCHKLLWHMVNASEQMPPPTPELQKKFDGGHKFGDVIKELYPNGIEVDWSNGFASGEQQTRELLKAGETIFEAGFTVDGCHARADVLCPDLSGGWIMLEAKRNKKIKEVFLYDIAFQRYVFIKAGVNITNCFLLTPGSLYRFWGPKVAMRNVTDSLNHYSRDINEKLVEFNMILSQEACPDVKPGPHCTTPYKCRMYDVCVLSK